MDSQQGNWKSASRGSRVWRHGMRWPVTGLAMMMCLMAGGCGLGEWLGNGFKVGPNYTPAPAPIQDHWIDYQRPQEEAQQQNTELLQWWQVFHDPVLNSLISDAYKQNLSLKAAGERIEQERALQGIAVGNLFPQTQEMTGAYTANKASIRTANPLPNQWYGQAEGGFNMSWELDFWGRFRRSIEAADASLEASIDNYDDVLVVLLSDVAANYIQYRTFQERLALAEQNVSIQEAAYQLASDNYRLGRSTQRDPEMAKQVLEQTRSSIPQFEQGIRQTGDALCVLLGISTQDLSARLGETGTIPIGLPQWSVGIPADLLRRRPDVREAERIAAAQSATIGVAKADLYPRFVLLGSIGVKAEDFDNLFDTPSSLAGFGGPSFQWNILNYGRIENAVKAQEAVFRQSVYNYENTVLNANRDVEDSLVAYVKSKDRYTDLSASVAAAERTLEITNDQYRHGAVDFTTVFIFEASLTNQQDSLAQSQSDIALSLVSLYRSLGGGWSETEDPSVYEAPAAPAPTTQRSVTSRPATLPANMGP
jgi:NodT family efflux transporter outer membrane factor (OMF) lipoprotein